MISLSKYNNLTQRVLAGLVGGLILIGAILGGKWSYFTVFLLICFFTQLEFYKLTHKAGIMPLKLLGILLGLGIFCFTFFVEDSLLTPKIYFLLIPVAILIFSTSLHSKPGGNSFTNIAYTYLGVLYIAGPFALFNFLVFYRGFYSQDITLGIFFLLWTMDVGAYFSGRYFGKTKLFERISPKKSWEGVFGGATLNILIAFIIAYFYPELALWQWLTISGIIIVMGTYGDLVESLFKRGIHIKDSGKVIPGHGGFLDRFDGFLLSIPVITAFLELVGT